MISNGEQKPAPKKKAAKKKADSDDESGSDIDSKPKKASKKPAAAKKSAAKKAKFDSDSEDFNMSDVAPARDRPGKIRCFSKNTFLSFLHSRTWQEACKLWSSKWERQ